MEISENLAYMYFKNFAQNVRTTAGIGPKCQILFGLAIGPNFVQTDPSGLNSIWSSHSVERVLNARDNKRFHCLLTIAQLPHILLPCQFYQDLAIHQPGPTQDCLFRCLN